MTRSGFAFLARFSAPSSTKATAQLWAASLVVTLALSGCAVTPPPPEQPSWTPVAFTDLAKWSEDSVEEALPALLTVCQNAMKKSDDAFFATGASAKKAGTVGAWRGICAEATQVATQTPEAIRDFFERQFQPWSLTPEPFKQGLFTGYYEPELLGSLKKEGPFQTPLWKKPHDFVQVELADFLPELKGRRIVGRVEKNRLKPYDVRKEIAAGSLETTPPRAEALVYVNDPVSAFFLEIQGSGRVLLQDGSTIRVGYEAQNGHGYTPIGRVLLDRGLIEKPVTMPKIRAWLEAHPDQAQEIMNQNPSVVFFKQRKETEPLGAMGLPLVAGRSLAIDPREMPLGVPLWLDAEKPATPRVVVSMDTGGAIKGLVRGDLFWGRGPQAEEAAGLMQARGTYYLLLPKGLSPNPLPANPLPPQQP